jgi:hypothetical protein
VAHFAPEGFRPMSNFWILTRNENGYQVSDTASGGQPFVKNKLTLNEAMTTLHRYAKEHNYEIRSMSKEDDGTIFLVDKVFDLESRMHKIASDVLHEAERKAELKARTRIR